VAAAAAAAAEAAAEAAEEAAAEAPATDVAPVVSAVVIMEPNDAPHDDHGVAEDGIVNEHGSGTPSVDGMSVSDHHHSIAGGEANGLENSHDDAEAMEAKPMVLLPKSINRRKMASPSPAAGVRVSPTTPPTAKRVKYDP
jgi:hypothetical protein